MVNLNVTIQILNLYSVGGNMNEEEYQLGYDDYNRSNEENQKVLIEQAYLRVGDSYWAGIKAAHTNKEMESLNA